MKIKACVIFCFAVVFYIFPITVFSNDFSNRAISALQELRKLNDEYRKAFISGDSALTGEKGKLLETQRANVSRILRSLPKEYCADPDTALLKEFIKTLIGMSTSTDEYPTYVFAEIYACDPDRVIKEILSLTPENQKIICDALDWGFKNITYKVESLPNYKELKEKLNNLKSSVHSNSKK